MIYKLKSPTKDYIWGGNKLRDYGKLTQSDRIAESWELSFYDGSESVIFYGKHNGQLLKDVVSEKELGTNISRFPFFPILIKFIDANDNLSIQVHPDDKYGLKYENSFGKTEMWYVVEASTGAMLHIGFNKDTTKEEIKTRIEDNTLYYIMNHIEVKKGDCFFIPSGTIHAIGKGVVVCEIQENSNLTYRIYDYGRVDKNGKSRELHIDKALNVLNLKKSEIHNIQTKILADCSYFKVIKENNLNQLVTDEKSFASITFLSGEGVINDIPYKKGDTFFISSNSDVTIFGDNEVIISKMPD